MRIEIVVDPARATPGQSLAARLSSAPTKKTAGRVAAPARAATRGATRGARRARGGRGGAATTRRPQKSVEELDQEMADYFGPETQAEVTATA